MGAQMMASFAGWMAFSLVVGGLVMLAALAAHDAQQAANRPVRWVWMSAIVMIVVLTVAAPLRQLRSPTRVTFPDTTMLTGIPLSSSSANSIGALWSSARDAVLIPIGASLQVVQEVLHGIPRTAQLMLAGLWLAASLLTLGVFLLSYRRMRRVMHAWPIQQVDSISARIAPSTGPAVVGLAPSEIVLPAWLLARPLAERQLVVAHEAEHVRAHDPWLLVLACGAVAILPWHPALWFALNRLQLAVELDCDRRVLRRGIAPADYGSLLIDLSAVRPLSPSPLSTLSMPAFSFRSSFLERRLLAMTSRPSKFAGSRRFVGALIAVAAVVTACESKLPTSAEINGMDVSSAQEQAKKVALVADGKTVYLVDGKKVSEEQAKKMSAEQIASVSLRKATTGSGVQEIAITSSELTRRRGIELKGALMKTVPDSGAVIGMKMRTRGPDSLAEVRLVGTKMRTKFDGLLVLDGKIVDASELDRISPDHIGSIEVVKGAAAQAKYTDARAANGVIVVNTKR